MDGRKELTGPVNNGILTIDEHIKQSEPYKLKGERIFQYDLNDKATKAKLVKGSKRVPFLVEENSSSCTLIFSSGSWIYTVRPSVGYWEEIKGDQTCQVGDSNIKIGGIKTGKDLKGNIIDSQIVFFIDGYKVTCHFYNTTQKILVNGHGYKKIVDIFLKPFFMSKIDSSLKDIQSYNEILLEKLGHKTVKRSAVRSKVGTTLGCNRCTYAPRNIASLKRHKKNQHVISFEASLSLREHPQSTRNNSVVEKLMLEDVSVSDLPIETVTLDESTFCYTCEECKYRTKSKTRMNT